MRRWMLMLCAVALLAAEYSTPAGLRPAIRRPGAASILPGGRIIAPLGHQHVTGPGPFGLAIGPNGKTIVTANVGPERFSLTFLEREKLDKPWVTRQMVARKEDKETDENSWRSLFMGLVFSGDHTLFASEGNTGRVRVLSVADGVRDKAIELDRDGFHDSFTGDLAYDPTRGLLYVLDQANFRLVTLDARKNRVLSSLRVGRLPWTLALSPDKRKAYIANLGMFEYKAVPGADLKQAIETGLPFPAFGFPSRDSQTGVQRQTARGPVEVPGLGDPNAPESNSVSVINLENPAEPRVETFIRTGLPVGKESAGGSSPSGVLATADRIFVSNAHNDSISVIDAKTNALVTEIPIRIPGLENLRGILPLGLAYHAASGWLLVAEAGINAVGIVDTKQMRHIGHLPVGWFPTRVAIEQDTVYVTNAKGHGAGPNAQTLDSDGFAGVLRRGSLSVFPIPDASELAGHTARVLQFNGFQPTKPAWLGEVPREIRHVVVIVKENRAFDEMLGDIRSAANGPVIGAPGLARYGQNGRAYGGKSRLSLQKVSITPNHHALATRWSLSDNFYADAETSVDGHHWLAGSYPNAWTEASLMASYAGQKDFRFPTTAPGRLLFAQSSSSVHPEELLEAGTLWNHLERHGISFRNFGEGLELAGIQEEPGMMPIGGRFLTNMPLPDILFRHTSRQYPGYNVNIPDQFRADRFISEIEERYVKGREELPRLLFIALPNDHTAKPRPEDGYPFEASFVADNDLALGRIVDFLSHTPWWRRMAIFVTEADAQGGRDHIDAHRTVLLAIGPYIKLNYVSHVNSSFPGLLKTAFRLLSIPPLNLFDAASSDLSDCFARVPDFEPYKALPVDSRLFDPVHAREQLTRVRN